MDISGSIKVYDFLFLTFIYLSWRTGGVGISETEIPE